MKIKKLKNFIFLTLSGLIVCMIIGLILAGTNILLPNHLAFRFTFFGLFGSLLYAVLKFSSNRDFIFITILFYILDVIIIGQGGIVKFIIHGSYSIFFAGSIYLYAKVLEQDNLKVFLSNIFSISSSSAFAFCIAVLVLTIFPKYKFDYSFLEGETFMGLLIGFGLGVGFHLYHRYQSKIKFVNETKA
jgi:hypothetical protein